MYYYSYTDPNGKQRGIQARSKYEALYNASCICGQIIPSNMMKRANLADTILNEWVKDGVTFSVCRRLDPSRATAALARHKMNKIGF